MAWLKSKNYIYCALRVSSQLQVPRTPIKDLDTNLAKKDLINQILTFRTINWSICK